MTSIIRNLRLILLSLALSVAIGSVAAESGQQWELADGGSIEGTITAVRGSMVQMETAKGKSLISISRFSDTAQTAIREKFPETGGGTRKKEEKKEEPKGKPSPDETSSPPGAGQALAAKAEQSRPSSPAPAIPSHPGLRTLKAGDLAPQLRLRKYDSEETITLESLRGRLVLLVFWNASEPYALNEIQYLAAIHKSIPPEVVTIIGVSVDPRWRIYSAAARQLGAHWPSHHDPARAVLRHWGVTAVPTTVVIGQDGRIVREHIFAMELPKFLQEMDLLPKR